MSQKQTGAVMAWNDENNKNPWSGNNQTPPELEEVIKDFKNKFRFVNGGFFIRPLSRSGINFASIFGNLPIFREWTVFTTSPTIK